VVGEEDLDVEVPQSGKKKIEKDEEGNQGKTEE